MVFERGDRDASQVASPGGDRFCRRGGLTSDERMRMKDLEREARERRRANEILRKAQA